MSGKYIKSVIKTIPDYPKPGIMFRDVTSVLEDHEAFNQCIELMAEHYKSFKFDKIAGTEARGFLFGAPLALSMGIGFIPVRKPGKLPRATITEAYELEYGTDTLEMRKANIQGSVLVVDDVLATGGTAIAIVELLHDLGVPYRSITVACLVNISFLNGKHKLREMGINVETLINVDE